MTVWVLVAAAVHLYLVVDGTRENNFLRPAFMLNAVAGAVIAVLRFGWRLHWGRSSSPPWAFVIFTTKGLLGVDPAGLRGVNSGRRGVVSVPVHGLLLQASLPLRSRGGGEHHPSVRRADLH